MKLEGFSSLFELFAAVNIAFVVVDCAKSYTNILAKKVFNLQDLIQERFDQLEQIFADRISLDNIESLNINGTDASFELEACKRKQEKLSKGVKESKEELKASIDQRCNFKNFANQCLWAFFFCVTVLFFIGLSESAQIISITGALFYLTVLTTLFYTLGWVWGEKGFIKKIPDLLLTIIVFLAATVLSLVLGYSWGSMNEFAESYNHIIIPASALIPILNFIIYFMASIFRIQKVKNDIKEKTDALNIECQEWQKMADPLIGAQAIFGKLNPNS